VPKIHKAFDRAFIGFRAKLVDVAGAGIEYTDPMPSRAEARNILGYEGAPRPEGSKIVVVKVFGPIIKKPDLRKALEDLLDGYKHWGAIKSETGLSDERCKEIWQLAGRSL